MEVKQFKALHLCLDDDMAHCPDRVFSGQCLATSYLRSRWEDSQWIAQITLDIPKEAPNEGFVQADTLETKTSTSAQKATTFLPMTALSQGLFGDDWAQTWLRLRKQMGLRDVTEPVTHATCRPSEPMMPQISHAGKFGSLPLSSSDASRWLREILMQYGCSEEEVRNTSTHSLKAGLLAFCAKYGVPPDVRKLLGYHVSSSDGSMLHYSRDAMATPLRWLARVMSAIRDGSFIPDSTRSGRFIQQPELRTSLETSTAGKPIPRLNSEGSDAKRPKLVGPAEAPENDGIGKDKPQVSDTSDSSSDSSTESDNTVARWAESTRVAGPACSKTSRGPAINKSEHLMYHKRLMTVHAKSSTSEGRLACGRRMCSAFLDLGPDDSVTLRYPRCSTCFGNQRVASPKE